MRHGAWVEYDDVTGKHWVVVRMMDERWVLTPEEACAFGDELARAAAGAEAEGRGEAPTYPPGVRPG